MNINLYISEACGTCAHSEVCVHRRAGNKETAMRLAEGVAPILPEPFKVRVFCAKYQAKYQGNCESDN